MSADDVMTHDIETLVNIEQLLAKAGLTALRRQDAVSEWRNVSAMVDYLPVAYSEAMIDYQLAYCRGAGWVVEDISLVLYHDNRPCGIWPLSLLAGAEESIGSNGQAILPPLFISGFAAKSEKTITKACQVFLEAGLQFYKSRRWRSGESFRNKLGLSEWHQQAMERGATVEVRHELFVDLSLSMAEIKSSFRKSFKALISSGLKHWQISILKKSDAAVWEEFRELHQTAAGRVTRSAESWEQQDRTIAEGDGFLVYLRDTEGRMVGGGLFHVTHHEGVYAVGAYDRNLFDRPLGHVVQYCAIEEMKQRALYGTA